MDEQADAVAFLADPATHGGAPVEVIETHISRIFLSGDRAWKMKRAVHLPYADFSTPALRLTACQAELTLNRRTAPALYLRVRRLTRDADGIAFDGTGELVDGRPLLFDCIEFNEQLASIDVAYDLAFLLMDLWHRGLAGLANLAANRWCDATGDDEAFALLPFFMAVRAAVRAHVIATQAETADGGRDGLAAEARAYSALALALLAPSPVRLVALGGLSGSGKTTVAEALAPHLSPPPGARLLESDRLRKAMHGVAADIRLPPQAYAPGMSAQVYAQMTGRSTAILAQGAPVVANAVHDREPDRAAIEQAARAAGAGFLGVWLDAAPALLRQRVAARRGGASDATLAVLESQLQRTGDVAGWHRIDAGQPAARIVQRILALPDDDRR